MFKKTRHRVVSKAERGEAYDQAAENVGWLSTRVAGQSHRYQCPHCRLRNRMACFSKPYLLKDHLLNHQILKALGTEEELLQCYPLIFR